MHSFKKVEKKIVYREYDCNSVCLRTYNSEHLKRGWTKEVGVRAELRGTLVRALRRVNGKNLLYKKE